MSYDPAGDLKLLDAMLASLDGYLRGSDLYGATAPNLPRMTLGSLRFTLHRLEALPGLLSTAQQSQVQAARQEYERICNAWRVHYEEKLTREKHARLRDLRNFVEELRQNPRRGADYLGLELRHRSVLEHVRADARDLKLWDQEEETELNQRDQQLRSYLNTNISEFQWDADLAPAYPPEVFWWLHHPPAQR
ncbi:MAG: hypothetical protein HC915_00510 [Anaerolineae bacterium]|nr:hypothetical protein [Anaerolineae bacterium]